MAQIILFPSAVLAVEPAPTQHTCGGPKFGRLTAGCPRCNELKAGHSPRAGWGANAKRESALRCDAIRRHYSTGECERTCGPVCVRFDP